MLISQSPNGGLQRPLFRCRRTGGMEWEFSVDRTIDDLIREARRLPLPQQLTLIERLARSIQADLEQEPALRTELSAWDGLSDEALATHSQPACSPVSRHLRD